MKTLSLLPVSLAALVLAQAASLSPSVYILTPNQPASSSVADALGTLGYSRSGASPATDGKAPSNPDTYAILSSEWEYMDAARRNPNAKFILPLKAAEENPRASLWLQSSPPTFDAEPSNFTESARDFFSQSDDFRLLELDMRTSRSEIQAQKWEVLCDFLGLGYSVVERLKLWHFP